MKMPRSIPNGIYRSQRAKSYTRLVAHGAGAYFPAGAGTHLPIPEGWKVELT